MTETFVAIIAMMVALLGAMATAVVITAAFAARRDWQREKGFVELRSQERSIARSRPISEAALLTASLEALARHRHPVTEMQIS